MTISLHLEYKLTNPPKAKAAMPPGIRQDLIALTVMSVPRLPRLVPMHRSSPALVINQELKGVKIVLEPQVKYLRHLVTPSQEVYSVSTRDLVDVRHQQQVIISDPRDPQKLIKSYTLICLLVERVLPLDEPPTEGAVSETRLHELELVPVSCEDERLREACEGGV